MKGITAFQHHPRRRQGLVDQYADGKISRCERLQHVDEDDARRHRRPLLARSRMLYLDVQKETKNQIEREHMIRSCMDFRAR